MHRVLVADKLSAAGLDILRAAADIEVDEAIGLKPAELAAKIPPYHGLIVRSGCTVTAEVIAAAANLRAIGRAGIGVDNIDVEAATKKGVVVMNTPAGNNVTTAEHAISMMLALARSIPQATASMKSGKWEKGKFTGSEVFNKTLGIVGIGNIGSLVADRALGLKMKVIAYDPFHLAGGRTAPRRRAGQPRRALPAQRLHQHPHAAESANPRPDRHARHSPR